MSIFKKQDRLNWRLGDMITYNYDLDKIKAKLEEGADPNATHKDSYTRRSVLYRAADRGRADVVKLLLDKGAAVEGDRASDTPLMCAVSNGSVDVARVLLQAGANPNCRGQYREEPLLQAAHNANAAMIQALVEHGADINAQGREGNTPLHIVAAKGHANLVKYLMEHGADVTIANANMNTPANVAEKDFPRIADMIRGTEAQPQPLPPAPKAADASWSLTDAHEVAHVKDKELIGYRVTEIFNFSSRLYTQIAHNMKTGAESQAVKGFAELDDGRAVEAAHAALVKLGGSLPDAPDKKKLPTPGQVT